MVLRLKDLLRATLSYSLLFYLFPSSDALGDICKAHEPCIFKGKDEGWERYKEPSESEPKPYPIVSDSWKKDDTIIFYSIASFRDELCPKTLHNAFTKARHPDRLRIAVVQQNVEGDDVDCLEEYCRIMSIKYNKSRTECPYESQVIMSRQDARNAKGPTWARAIASSMLGKDAEFCLQTDAHMDFVRNWDVKMLEMWALTNNEYAVLSTYATRSEDLSKLEDGEKGVNGLHEVPHLCMITWNGGNGLIRNWGTKCMRQMPRPKITNIVWGAGLSFSKCHAERKVMYDPFTPGVFDGEEFNKGIRLWTYGYDIYSPHRVYIVHDYQKSQSNPIHGDWARVHVDVADRAAGVLRLATISHLPSGMDDPVKARALRRSKYGLGDRRSIDQAIEFSGFNFYNRTTMSNKCGNLQFVPFKEHPEGPEYVPLFDPDTFAPLEEPDEGSIYYDAEAAFAHRSAHIRNAAVRDAKLEAEALDVPAHMRERIRSIQSRGTRDHNPKSAMNAFVKENDKGAATGALSKKMGGTDPNKVKLRSRLQVIEVVPDTGPQSSEGIFAALLFSAPIIAALAIVMYRRRSDTKLSLLKMVYKCFTGGSPLKST